MTGGTTGVGQFIKLLKSCRLTLPERYARREARRIRRRSDQYVKFIGNKWKVEGSIVYKAASYSDL